MNVTSCFLIIHALSGKMNESEYTKGRLKDYGKEQQKIIVGRGELTCGVYTMDSIDWHC